MEIPYGKSRANRVPRLETDESPVRKNETFDDAETVIEALAHGWSLLDADIAQPE